MASVFVEAESIRQTDRTSPRSTALFPSVTLTVAYLSLRASSVSVLSQAKYTTRRAPEFSARMARCWDALTLRCVSRHRLQSGFSSSHCTAETKKNWLAVGASECTPSTYLDLLCSARQATRLAARKFSAFALCGLGLKGASSCWQAGGVSWVDVQAALHTVDVLGKMARQRDKLTPRRLEMKGHELLQTVGHSDVGGR